MLNSMGERTPPCGTPVLNWVVGCGGVGRQQQQQEEVQPY